jgi:hypothetical protein
LLAAISKKGIDEEYISWTPWDHGGSRFVTFHVLPHHMCWVRGSEHSRLRVRAGQAEGTDRSGPVARRSRNLHQFLTKLTGFDAHTSASRRRPVRYSRVAFGVGTVSGLSVCSPPTPAGAFNSIAEVWKLPSTTRPGKGRKYFRDTHPLSRTLTLTDRYRRTLAAEDLVGVAVATEPYRHLYPPARTLHRRPDPLRRLAIHTPSFGARVLIAKVQYR